MIARPDHLTVRPNPTTAVSMDPLSDVLRAVRLTGSVFLSGHFTAPWCIGVEITADECARVLPIRPAQIIGYHVVVEGRMASVNSDSESRVRTLEEANLPSASSFAAKRTEASIHSREASPRTSILRALGSVEKSGL